MQWCSASGLYSIFQPFQTCLAIAPWVRLWKSAFTGLVFLMMFVSPAFPKIRVASSLPDFASIAAAIGGDHVEVFSVAKAHTNPHLVEILPSYMVQVSKAEIYLEVGMGLDAWADAVIAGSRQNRIQRVDCSVGIPVLDKPTEKVDASKGDVHAQGNPHYWLDPGNGLIVAQTIAQALTRVDPNQAKAYAEGLNRFQKTLSERMVAWKSDLSFLEGKGILAYHSSWNYLAKAWGFRVLGYLEPYPGIPPTAKHLQSLLSLVQAQPVFAVLVEPYYPEKDAQFITRQNRIPVFRFTPSCQGVGADDYIRHFEDMVKTLSSAAQR